jgi:hypothetical protein
LRLFMDWLSVQIKRYEKELTQWDAAR